MINYNSDTFEEAVALCNTLEQQRARPPHGIETFDTKDVWGVVRAFARHTFEGGELWHEWVVLFDAFSGDERQVAIEYLAQSWHCPDTTLDAVFHAFCFQVLAVHVAAFRARGLDVLPPPTTTARVEAWETQHSITVPNDLRRFLTEISAGRNDGPETEWMFHIDDPLFVPFETLLSTEDGLGLENEGADHLGTLSRFLFHFSTTDEQGIFEVEEHLEQLAPGHMPTDSLVVLHHHFEGNHGDSTTYLITDGPLAEHTLVWSDAFHSGPKGGVIGFNRVHISTWLLAIYKEEVLGEEMIASPRL